MNGARVGDRVTVIIQRSSLFGESGMISETNPQYGQVRVRLDHPTASSDVGLGFGEGEVALETEAESALASLIVALREYHQSPYHMAMAKCCKVCAQITSAAEALP